MHALRLLVCILLAVPVGSIVERASRGFVREQPLFRPSDAPAVDARRVATIGVLAVAYVLAAIRFDGSSWLELFAYLALFAVLLLLSLVDLVDYRLPDVIVLPSISVGLVTVVVLAMVDHAGDRLRCALIAAAIAFAVLLIAHLISPRGMGFGDVKLAALLGLAVGWQATTTVDAFILVLWMLLIGFGLGSIAGVVLWVVRRGNAPFPFGPFLALGTVATILLSGALVG